MRGSSAHSGQGELRTLRSALSQEYWISHAGRTGGRAYFFVVFLPWLAGLTRHEPSPPRSHEVLTATLICI